MDVAHRRVWRGRFVLQCDEILNVASSFHDRYSEKRAGDDRTLKLSMTDGKQRVVGYEYRPCDSLHVLAPAGMKVAVTDAEVGADGFLYLRPENVTVLGGSVPRLEDARRRVVTKWSEPNRPAGGGATGGSREVRAWNETGSPRRSRDPSPPRRASTSSPTPPIDPAVDDDEKEGEKKGGGGGSRTGRRRRSREIASRRRSRRRRRRRGPRRAG